MDLVTLLRPAYLTMSGSDADGGAQEPA
jgi:hypothetical protein